MVGRAVMSGKFYDDCHQHQQKDTSSSQVSFFGCTDSTVLISEQRDRTPKAAQFWTGLGSRGWAAWTSKKWELVVTREGGPAGHGGGGGKARVPA